MFEARDFHFFRQVDFVKYKEQNRLMGSNIIKPSVYIETTIISYFTSKPSNDLLVLSRQRITEEWWNSKLPELDCYISQAVLDEIGRGDKAAASRRMKTVSQFKLL